MKCCIYSIADQAWKTYEFSKFDIADLPLAATVVADLPASFL